jgi:hypothetical protein
MLGVRPSELDFQDVEPVAPGGDNRVVTGLEVGRGAV